MTHYVKGFDLGFWKKNKTQMQTKEEDLEINLVSETITTNRLQAKSFWGVRIFAIFAVGINASDFISKTFGSSKTKN